MLAGVSAGMRAEKCMSGACEAADALWLSIWRINMIIYTHLYKTSLDKTPAS
jgi:hypothetical protein